MIDIKGVQSAEVEDHWPLVLPLVEKALAYGGGFTNAQDVLDKLLAREKQLWLILMDGRMLAICITVIQDWPRIKALHAPIIAGEGMHWWMKPLDDLLTRYGREHGCTKLTGFGRAGWKPYLKSIGWRENIVAYMKDIGDE